MQLDWAAIEISKQSHFLNASKVLEVGGGAFERSIALAERFPDKTFFSVDFFYSKVAMENVKNYAHLKNLNIIKGDVVSRLFVSDLFDYSFSIDVGEHIANIREFLEELSRVLRKGGIYYFVQNPFWTSNKGHHFHHWEEKVQSVLAGYKHIIFSREEMFGYLSGLPDFPYSPAEAVERIFGRKDLSRLSARETKKFYMQSAFDIERWDELLDENFNAAAASEAVSKSQGGYAESDFRVKAAKVVCINRKTV